MTTKEIIRQFNQLDYDVTYMNDNVVRVTDRLNPLWFIEEHISRLEELLLICQDPHAFTYALPSAHDSGPDAKFYH